MNPKESGTSSYEKLKQILNTPIESQLDLINLLNKLNDIIECQTSGIFHQYHSKLIYIAAYGKNGDRLLHQSLYKNESVEGRIFTSGESVLIEKSIETNYFKPDSSSARIILPITITGTPVFHNNRVIGGILGFNRQRNTLFTERDLNILKKISMYIADFLSSIEGPVLDRGVYLVNHDVVKNMPFPLFICSGRGMIEEYSNITADIVKTETNLYSSNIHDILNLVNSDNEPVNTQKISAEVIEEKKQLEIPSVRFEAIPDKTYDLIIKYINPDRMTHNILYYLIDTEDINSAKRQIITSVAHELRTPMTAIMGAVQILLSDFASSELTPTQEEFLNILKSQSERFSNVLSTILNFKESRESLGLKEEHSDLIRIVEAQKAVFAEKLKEHNMKIDIVGFDEEIRVRGEETSIKHIFNQILDNAIKFSPENTTITIADEGTNLQESKWYRLVSISDQGEGIDKEILPKIFDSFSRNDEAVHSKIGTGLGLSIVKQLIDTMGGDIDIENLDSGGTKVTLSFQT